MAAIIGEPIDRIDGPAKVTGKAIYAADAKQQKLAFGAIATAEIAYGEIKTIDASEARRQPGVLLIMTHENAPPQAPFVLKGEDPFARPKPQLDSKKIQYFGQPIALVVAITFEAARAAASLINVTYTKGKGAFDVEAADRELKTPKADIVGKPAASKIGDIDKAMKEGAVTVDSTYKTPYQNHNMMEPHASVASWEGDRLTVRCAAQLVESAHGCLANTLKLPKENVEVISEYIGGGFGGKLPIYADAILAALASRELKRPVKVVLTRQQMFHVTTHRGASVQRVRLAANKDGTLTGIAHQSFAQTARADDFVEPIVAPTRSLYSAANRLTEQHTVVLDLPIPGSMRAPGEAIGLLALEQAIDELAVKLDMDPIELRLKNEPKEDPEKHIPFSTRNLVQCLQQGAERFGWNKRSPKPGANKQGQWLVGMGVAAAIRGNILRKAEAKVMMTSAKTATVEMDMTDIGTGSYTIFAQIAAEGLDLPVDAITVKLGHSSYPITPGSGGSFGASSCGAALFDACKKLKAQLDKGEGPQGLLALGHAAPGDEYKKFAQFAYGAHFAEVAVDRDTGEVRLRRMLGAFDAGRILNAKTARSQMIGGMIWGVGSALHEEQLVDLRYGSFMNVDLANYHVPVHADVPAVEAIALSAFDSHANALGSKGVGELGICGAGAAVANAIYNACGARVREYPITLDKILPALG